MEYEPHNIPLVYVLDPKSKDAKAQADLHKTSKADLLKCFRTEAEVPTPPTSGALIVDLSVIVQVLGDGHNCTTYRDFYAKVYDHIIAMGKSYERIDIVTDNYLSPHPLKEITRKGRGSGAQVQFSEESSFNGPQFREHVLTNVNNKCLLYKQIINFMYHKSLVNTKLIVMTDQEKVLSNDESLVMEDCSHLEADYRIITHACHIVRHSKIFTITVRSSDTDVVILLISYLHFLQEISYEIVELVSWCGGGKDHQYYMSIRRVVAFLTPAKCRGLSFLHAFSGCDYIEGFYMHGKKKWMDAYLAHETIHDTFAALTRFPQNRLERTVLDAVEGFVCKVYLVDPDDGLAAGRLDLVRRKTLKSLRWLPPSREALKQHLYRSVYVAGCIWGTAWQSQPECPDPTFWGWCYRDHVLYPLWTEKIGNHKDLTDSLFKKCMCKKRCPVTNLIKCSACDCRRLDKGCYSHCACRGECCQCSECDI